MLVLTLKHGEVLQVGEDVCALVQWTRRGEVRLVIQAPQAVSLRRLKAAEAAQHFPNKFKKTSSS